MSENNFYQVTLTLPSGDSALIGYISKIENNKFIITMKRTFRKDPIDFRYEIVDLITAKEFAKGSDMNIQNDCPFINEIKP